MRRFFMAFILAIAFIFLWHYFFPPPAPVQPPEVGEPAPGVSGEAPAPPAGTEPPADHSDAGPPAEESSPPSGLLGDESGMLAGDDEAEAVPIDFGADLVVAEEERTTVLENEAIRAELTNRGAQLVSFQLKKHLSSEGQPLEVVRQRGSDPYPFALVVGGSKSHRLNKALFEGHETRDEEGRQVLRFRHRSELGAAEKIFRWSDQHQTLEVDITLVGETDWGMILGPGVLNPSAEEVGNRFFLRQVGYRRGEESETFHAGKAKEDIFLPGTGIDWVSLENNHFIAAAFPRFGLSGVIVRPVVQRLEVVADHPRFLPANADLGEEESTPEQLLLLQAGGERLELLTYLGAKEYERLVDLGHGIEETVRWGFVGFLSRPLYYGLKWIHENIVANYGWAIVLLTCLIKLLFFPLTFKSQQSMTKMQELNPKIQAIRNKFRSKLKDRQGRPVPEAQRQMNEEIMKVYKSAGVNPVSGCFPMFLQLPVFFALYRLLASAVELRNAPWMGWITDLSLQDPYYILPLVMGATSLAMQKMMPSSPDPMQRRMMQLMPIMFTFFAFAFPSGLVLYWLTNNLLTMVQQAILLKARKKDD